MFPPENSQALFYVFSALSEGLEGVFTKAADSVCNCDLLIVGGTSLSVYPAALLINFVRHKNILLFNKTNTSADIAASEAISLPIGQAFGSIAEKLNMPL